MRKQLLDKFRAEKDKMLPEKRMLVLTHFPRYSASCSGTIFKVTNAEIVEQSKCQLLEFPSM